MMECWLKKIGLAHGFKLYKLGLFLFDWLIFFCYVKEIKVVLKVGGVRIEEKNPFLKFSFYWDTINITLY